MISLSNVHLFFPVPGFAGHSLQRSLYHKVGGLLGRRGDALFDSVQALRGITINIGDGERLGLIGHNGAGKTTLLRVICGVYPPSLGMVDIRGRVSALTNITLGMDENASGIKNIIFRLVFMGYSFREAKNAIDEIVDFSELGEFIHLPLRMYSTGMYLRLAFAISTHFTPDILVLDEVIGAGDLAFQSKAIARIKNLFSKSRIMILAAHNLDSIAAYCTRAAILSQGEMIGQGTPDEMIAAYKGEYVRDL